MSTVLIVLVLLSATTVGALGALAALVYRPPSWLADRALAVDPEAAAVLDRTPGPPVPRGVTRRLISIEILNPIELAGTRGRLAAIAGTLAPGLTRRIVYDQTLKILRGQLAEQRVHADVRVHTLSPAPPTVAGQPTVVEVSEPIDLGDEA